MSSTLRSSGGVGSDGPKGPASVEPAPPRVRRMASRLLEERLRWRLKYNQAPWIALAPLGLGPSGMGYSGTRSVQHLGSISRCAKRSWQVLSNNEERERQKMDFFERRQEQQRMGP